MKSQLYKARFWAVTCAAIVVAATTFSLGQWQLRRAAAKEGLQAAISAQNKLPALDLIALLAMKNIADSVHRTAVLEGRWNSEHTVFLENRPMKGRVGFVVVTPLVLEGQAQPILVQRGWVPRNFADRTALPEVKTPQGLVRVEGRIAPPPSKLYEFEGAQSTRIRQNLDLEAFASQTGLPVLPVTLLQTGAPSDGLVRDWPMPTVGVEKNHGYAFQWFAMCALVIVLYLWFQVIQPWRRQNKNLPFRP